MEKDSSEENQFPDFYRAVCDVCNWTGIKTPSFHSAEMDGKSHEDFENNSPLGRRHFTHVETIFWKDGEKKNGT